jgi:hypothetical protein
MTGIVALVLIVIFFIVIAGIGKSGRMMTSDARGLFSRKCQTAAYASMIEPRSAGTVCSQPAFQLRGTHRA